MLRVRPLRCLLAVLWFGTTASLLADPTPAPDAPKGLFERDTPTPDPGGFRAKLADHGIVLGVIYAGEVFGNPAGGYRQGIVYDGLLTVGLDVDFEKLAGWKGLKFHVLAYDPHGPSGTDKDVRDLGRFSNIDSFDTFRLFELWLEGSFFDNVVNLRAGQIAADAEFVTTQGGPLFLSSNFGAFPVISLNVPSPIYPQAAPGLRLRLNTPDARFYFQGGVYAGNPDADRDGDPSPGSRTGTAYNDQGVRFPISGNQGLFAIYETGFLFNGGKDDHGLPGTYRIGGFFHSDTFSDNRTDDHGRSLASPLSTGVPRARDGNEGVYAAVDQVVYRAPGDTNSRGENVSQTASAPVGNAEDSSPAAGAALPSGPELRIFGRLGLATEDRSLADLYAETGLNYRGLIRSRGRDLLGIGFTYTNLSGDLRQLARETNRLDGAHEALPDYEALLEVTYEANLAPWLQVQPDLQYIIHPGGSPRYGDALVLGVRTVVTF